MIREVELVSYLPPFMQEYKEPVEALEAENPEFDIVWNAMHRILYNRFISTADEYGISRFEKILHIYPNKTDTLELRRMRVQNRWSNSIPYTMRVLAKKLIELLGGEHNFLISSDFKTKYELVLTVYSIVEDDNISAEINHLFATMIPINIVTDIIYEGSFSGNIYYGAILQEAEILEIKQR